MADPVATVVYNSKKLIPAPFLSFSKQTKRTGDETAIGTSLSVTLTGKLSACKGFVFAGGGTGVELYGGTGYPADDTNCCKFQNLLDMQEAIREHFAITEDYHWFEVANPPNAPKKWRARVVSVEFKEGKWVDYVDYTIVLDLQSEEDVDNYLQFSEDWDVQFQENDGEIYTLSHRLTCQSKQFANEYGDVTPGWEKARAWAATRLAGGDYINKIKEEIVYEATGFNLGAGYDAYNYVKQESINEFEGNYSITETFVLSKDPIIRTISIQVEAPRAGDITIRVSGNFKAFLNQTRTNTTAVDTAFDAWDADGTPYTIANGYYTGSKTLITCPINKSVTRGQQQRGNNDNLSNETTRTIEFSYEYSDGGETLTDTEITVNETVSKVGDCAHTVRIDGNIQGFSCTDNTDKLANAVAEYATIVPLTLANAAYTGTGTLTLVNQTLSKNERRGTVNFTFEYSDKYDLTAEVIITVTESQDTNDCGITKISVQGTIKGICAGATTAIESAEIAYAAISPADYCGTNSVVSRSKSTNAHDGTITFNFECSSRVKQYTEEQSISLKYDIEQTFKVVTISGTITPMCPVGCATEEACIAAQVAIGEAAWALIEPTLDNLAQNLLAATDCATVQLKSSTLTTSTFNGRISYDYTYSCPACTSVTGALEDSIDITYNRPADVVAQVPILGRTLGPILQDKGTVTAETCQVAVSARFKPNCTSLAKPATVTSDVLALINSAICCNKAYYTQSDQETWNPRTGRYGRTISFIFENC